MKKKHTLSVTITPQKNYHTINLQSLVSVLPHSDMMNDTLFFKPKKESMVVIHSNGQCIFQTKLVDMNIDFHDHIGECFLSYQKLISRTGIEVSGIEELSIVWPDEVSTAEASRIINGILVPGNYIREWDEKYQCSTIRASNVGLQLQ